MSSPATREGGLPATVFGRELDDRDLNTLLVSVLIFSGSVLYYFLFLYKAYYIPVVLILGYCLFSARAARHKVEFAFVWPLAACYVYILITVRWSPLRSQGFYYVAVELPFYCYALLSMLSRRCTDDVKLRLIQAASLASCVTAAYALLTTGHVVDVSKASIRSLYGSIFLISIPAHVYLVGKRKSMLSLGALAAIVPIGLSLDNRTLLVFGPLLLIVSTLLVAQEQMKSFNRLRILVGLSILCVPLVLFGASKVDWSKAYYRVSHGTSFDIGRTVLQEQLEGGPATPEDLERRVMTFVELQMFFEHPVLGAGYGSTEFFVKKVSHFKTQAHGMPTMLLSETGLVGAALFGMTIVLSLVGFSRKLRSPIEAVDAQRVWFELLSFIAVLVVGLFHQVYHDIYFYMFVGTGLYYGAESRMRRGIERRTGCAAL